jgi:hypothetical protein
MILGTLATLYRCGRYAGPLPGVTKITMKDMKSMKEGMDELRTPFQGG